MVQCAQVFTSPSYLTDAFRKQTRLTPTQNNKETITHSQSSPPDQRTLVDQVRTVEHPYLQQAPPLCGPVFNWDPGRVRNEPKLLELYRIPADHVSGSSISNLTGLCDRLRARASCPRAVARQVSSSANSAGYFRNYRADDDTHGGTTGCSLNY